MRVERLDFRRVGRTQLAPRDFPPQAQEDVWGRDDSAQLSTSVAPTGTVERVAGGFRLAAAGRSSSGCDFCQWVVLGGVAPPLEPGAPPDARVFLVPRADYRIEDNWHVTGLCGTGSKDIVVEEALVPEYRTHSFVDAFHLRHPAPRSTTPRFTACRSALIFRYAITSPAIGAALGALDAFREQSRRRINLNTRASVAEDPFIQHRLAESAAEIGAARDRMLGDLHRNDGLRSRRREIPLELRARYRWDAGKAIDWSVRAADRVFEASGGHGLFLDNPIQRAWRDVHAMRAHAGNNPERPRSSSAAPNSACRPPTSVSSAARCPRRHQWSRSGPSPPLDLRPAMRRAR